MFKNRILALIGDFVYSVLTVFIMRFISGFLFEDLIFTTSHLVGMITAVFMFFRLLPFSKSVLGKGKIKNYKLGSRTMEAKKGGL